MTGIRDRNKAGSYLPALFSFITLRRERFGAIVYNPFLAREETLDHAQTQVASMCTGTHSVEEIKHQLAATGWTNEQAAQLVDDTLLRLDRLWCLNSRGDRTPVSPSQLIAPAHRDSSTASFSAPKHVIWDVTYQCNLYCPHCLTQSGRRTPSELTTSQSLHLIQVLSDAGVFRLSMVGGEPFLRDDLPALIETATDRGMRVDIASNGLEVPEDTLEKLRDLPVFQVQVSIDGIEATHDRFRGRTGSFAAACKTLRLLSGEGITTSVSATATSQNIHQIGDIIDLAVELGCRGFKAIPFLPAGRGQHHKELALGQLGCLTLARTLLQKSREFAGRISVSTESTFVALLEGAKPCAASDGSMVCAAGNELLSIGADATAYPCPFLQDFPLGNLLTNGMERIWHESPTLDNLRTLQKSQMVGACGSCEYAPGDCRGGCRAAAYFASGDLRASDPLCFKSMLQDQTAASNCGSSSRS